MQKRNEPSKPNPTWRELLLQIRRNGAAKKALAEWQPKMVGPR
jgi:hypothetical protein